MWTFAPQILLTVAVTLNGAGATFPAPLYNKWFQTFEERHPHIKIEYAAVGSGAGIERMKSGSVDFAASDAPLSDADLAAMPKPVRQVPSVAGGVVPISNLPGIPRDLRFTPG